MCETKVVLMKGDEEEEIMSEAAMIKLKDDGVVVYDILGNSKSIGDCELEEIDFIKHRAVLRKKE